jgi:hypothetical protein
MGGQIGGFDASDQEATLRGRRAHLPLWEEIDG